jgi:hypothetical protein
VTFNRLRRQHGVGACHPEFSPAFSAALIETLRDVYGPLAGPALLSLLQQEDGGRAADWLRHFVNGGGLDAPG